MPGPTEVWSNVLSFLTNRPARRLAQGGVLTAVIGATLAFADAGSTFTLSIDGRESTVEAAAGTVRQLLDSESVALTGNDLVAPALDSPLTDGQRVVVRHARPLTVRVDGAGTTYQTTELTVGAALAALQIPTTGARLSVPAQTVLDRDGTDVAVSTPKRVVLTADGSRRTITSNAPTVADLLTDQQLTLGSLDTVNVPRTRVVSAGLNVTVVRVRQQRVVVTEPIAYGTTKKADPKLDKGVTKVVTKGVPGAQRVTYTVTLADGRQISKVKVGSVVAKAPVAAVVQVGSKPVAATSASTKRSPSSPAGSSSGTRAVDRLNWAALAKCESSGNPRAVNPAGYYGLYQFSLSTWRSVGGTGNPINASPAEQLKRAKILYLKAGAGQWGCGRHLFD